MSAQTDFLDAAVPAPRPPAAPRWLPIRSLGPRHRVRLAQHLQTLGDDDRHLRFGQVVSDEQIQRYVDAIDFERDRVFGVFDTRLRLVAMAHLAFSADGQSTEFGVSVLAYQRGRGFGARLFEHAVMQGRNRGATRMVINLARENQSMLAIVKKSGAAVQFEGADVVADLALPGDTLGTHLEAILETQAAEWDYRIKHHALRLDRLWHDLLPPEGR